MSKTDESLRREITWSPAYDLRPEGKGQQSVTMYWWVHGPQGSVNWTVYTGWSLPSGDPSISLPMDLGYHADAPHYDGQLLLPCDKRPRGECYYDGSGLNAAWMMKTLATEGGDAAWEKLEAYYRCQFEDGPWPWADDPETWQSVQRYCYGEYR